MHGHVDRIGHAFDLNRAYEEELARIERLRKEVDIEHENANPIKVVRGVYVIAPHLDGPCKIGMSDDVAFRAGQLQVGNWVPLFPVFHAYFYDEKFEGRAHQFFKHVDRSGVQVESACHNKLSDPEFALRGEWFALTAKEAVAVIQICADQRGLKRLLLRDVETAETKNVELRSMFISKAKRNLQAVGKGIEALKAASRADEGDT